MGWLAVVRTVELARPVYLRDAWTTIAHRKPKSILTYLRVKGQICVTGMSLLEDTSNSAVEPHPP